MHSFTVEGPLDGLIDHRRGRGRDAGHERRRPRPGRALSGRRRSSATRRSPPSDAAIRAFAEDAAAAGAGDSSTSSTPSCGGIRDRLRFDVDATDTGTSAIEAFAHRHGVCQDFAHVFIAAARHLGIPGALCQRLPLPRRPCTTARKPGTPGPRRWSTASAGSASTRPTAICPTEAYVRVAVGLDYLGAAPVRGTRYGGSGEELSVRVHVDNTSKSR